jgi:protein involved in polysaccharide export with SLBB domain
MNWKCFVAGMMVAAGAVLFSGCETPNVAPVVCEADVIRVGDSLTVTFLLPFESKDSGDKEVQVRGDGTINLPLIGSVKAADKKFGALEGELQALYVPKYYRQLTIGIRPKDRFYTVGGEVKQPGRQVYLGETTVLRAIASCGDFTEFANRRNVEILRANGARESVNANKARKKQDLDQKICPGDAIYVPRSF